MKNIKEDKVIMHDFGKHPGYRKKPMSLTGYVDAETKYRDWDDDSVKGDEPFGKKIGSSAPYNNKVVNIITDNVIKAINKLYEEVDEKNFLQLPEQPAPAPAPMPAPMPTPTDNAPMDTQQPPMEENPFGGNFDAGVEADEDTDPENYIQQLTGKLTQVMRDYSKQEGNNSQELDKYVLGMIIKQCVKSMDESDRKGIIKKIKETPLPGEENTEEEMEAMNPETEEMPQTEEQPPMQETRIRLTKSQAIQLMECLNDDSPRQDDSKKNAKEINPRNYPFNAPNFKQKK